MMHDDFAVKDKLLQGLIDLLEERLGGDVADRVKPKGLAVEVQAKDQHGLTEGLDKAKDVLTHGDIKDELEPKDDPVEEAGESDEERLRELMDGDDDSGDDKEKDKFGRR